MRGTILRLVRAWSLTQHRPGPVQIPKGGGAETTPGGRIQLEFADRVPRIAASRALVPRPLFNLG